MPGCRSSAVWAGVCLALQLGCGGLSAARPQLDLTGAWDFYPDVGDSALEGVTVKPGRIVVPGAWQAQGYGRPGGAIPASLLDARTSPADHLRHNLTARCLYARVVEVPASWNGRRVFLVARRVYACADVSVNGKRIGDWEGFCSPFEFERHGRHHLGRSQSNRHWGGQPSTPGPGHLRHGKLGWQLGWFGRRGLSRGPKPCLTNNLPDFTGSTVLLTTAGLDARSFYSGETKRVGLRLWHYGAGPIQKARLAWRLREGDKTLKSGETSGISCAPGETQSLGEAVLDGLSAARPQYVTLQVELRQAGRLTTRNAWEFYAYPRVGRSEALPGVYSEAGPVPGAVELKADAPIPEDLRLLITRRLKRDRHAAFLGRGNAAVLLLGAGGFEETRAGYFLNQNGGAFGGIIEDHPVFASIPHEGRLSPGLYQLIAGGGLLDAEWMPAALRDGSVVWGLRLTAWISPVKDLQRVTLFSDVVTDTRLHLVLCDLDLLADKPECRYVLAKTLDYLLAGQPSRLTRQCAAADVEKLLH